MRDYEIRDGVAFPIHIQSTVDTRVVGRAELDISFSNFSRDNADDDADAVAGVSSETAGAAPAAEETHTSDVSISPETIHKPSTPDGPEL